MKITLNLATKPYADQGPALKRLRIGMGILAVLLIGLGFGLLHFHQAALAMASREAAMQARVAKIRQERTGYERQMQQPDNAKVLTQAEFLNGLFDEKAFSWTAAMEDLERVLPVGVQVTAIEPARNKDGSLTLRLRISGLRERSVEMVRNMERSRRFVAPRIAGENAESTSAQGDLQRVQDTGPARVSFDILAEYNPATIDERKAELAAAKREHPRAEGIARPQQVVRPQYVAPNPARPRQFNQFQPVPGQPNGQPNPGPMGNRPPYGMPNRMPNRIPGVVPGQTFGPGGNPQPPMPNPVPNPNQNPNSGDPQ
jgi:type IV pilus assembly protein PilN